MDGEQLPMQVGLKVLSMRSAGTESEGTGANRVSWIISGERAWTSMVSRWDEYSIVVGRDC